MSRSSSGGSRGRANSREKILRAAFKIAAEDGAAAVTIDGVAKQAGVSKGGLLYHFPTKDDLLRAIIRESLERFYERMNARIARDPDPRGRTTRAYVEAVTEPPSDDDPWSTLLSAIYGRPELGSYWQDHVKKWIELDEQESFPVVDGVIARLAADGMWFRNVLRVDPVPPGLREQVLARLLELAGKK